MTKLTHTFKTDILFKLLFVKYPELLKELVAQLLGIRLDSIEDFRITNSEMPPESLGNKFCRLDINMIVEGQRIDLEIQVENEGDYPERSLFNWAREYSSALPAGADYIELPCVIVISILDFILFRDCDEFYSEYRPLEVMRHTQLTDKMCLMYFELPKLPNEVTADDELKLWLALFKAETKEEFSKIEALGGPVMKKAINAYNDVVVSPEFKEAARLREKARHNEAAALRNARKQQTIVIAKRMLVLGKPVEEIIKITGLTRKEIEDSRDADE